MKDLASHILDIVQNSIRAQARHIEIRIEEDRNTDLLSIGIEDDGCGMDEGTLERIRDPFFTSRTVRKVGLGIPLLQQNAEQTGGRLLIRSTPGRGTGVVASFSHSHLDRPPLGDIAGTISLMMAVNPDIEFTFIHYSGRGCFRINSREVKNILDGISLNDPQIFPYLKEMIEENEKEIREE